MSVKSIVLKKEMIADWCLEQFRILMICSLALSFVHAILNTFLAPRFWSQRGDVVITTLFSCQYFPISTFYRVENRVRKAVILPIYWKYAVGEIVNTTMSLCACVHLFTDLWLIWFGCVRVYVLLLSTYMPFLSMRAPVLLNMVMGTEWSVWEGETGERRGLISSFK